MEAGRPRATTDVADDAREAVEQLQQAVNLLMLEGYSGRELEQVRHELDAIRADPWADTDAPEADESST